MLGFRSPEVFTLDIQLLFDSPSFCAKNRNPFNWLQNEVDEVVGEIRSHKKLFKFKDCNDIPMKQFFAVNKNQN